MTLRRSPLIALAWLVPAFGHSAEVKVNPITGYEVTLMPPTREQPELFGWIRLLNGTRSAAYVYIESASPSKPALNGSKEYIITAMPVAHLPLMLDVLRNERNMQIRYFDPQSPGVEASVFIEPRDKDELAGDAEASALIRERRPKR
jgi:hypothetical protein